MEINQQELPRFLALNLGNWVGVRGKVEDTEGYIHSTRFGYVELKDGKGGFNPSIDMQDIMGVTLSDGTIYTVKFPF